MNKVFFYIQPAFFQLLSPFTNHLHSLESLLTMDIKQSEFDQPSDNNYLVWQKNKLRMQQIMKKAPVTGVYKNQNPSSWDTFFQFYIDFLNAQIGPRGQCAKKIRQQLKLSKLQVDEVLAPYNLNHSMHIRSLYVRFRYFIPCHEYHLYQTAMDSLAKYQESFSRLQQPDHPMYKSIMEGMIKKRGPHYPYKDQIEKLKENYATKIQNLQKAKLGHEQVLSQSKQYNDWIKMNSVMKKWFDQWVQADSGMGKDSCNRGQLFETKVLMSAIPHILKRQYKGALSHLINDQSLFTPQSIQNLMKQATEPTSKKDKFNKLHIFLNMKWVPRSLGQIDIAIVQYKQTTQRYEALILIECKARLFDIREASYQVFPQYLKQDNKTELSSKYGPVFLSDKVTSYIVTTLPDFDFVLPIESNLKAALDRITKDKPIETIQQNATRELLFAECSKKFGNELSPLEWFLKNDSDNIIVLSRQT